MKTNWQIFSIRLFPFGIYLLWLICKRTVFLHLIRRRGAITGKPFDSEGSGEGGLRVLELNMLTIGN
jgi:hypothetical protein